MFCLCGPREELNEESTESSGQLPASTLTCNMNTTQIIKKYEENSYQKQISKNRNNTVTNKHYNNDQKERTKEDLDFISQYDKNYYNVAESQLYHDICSSHQFEETKTNYDQIKLIHQGDGLLVRLTSINQSQIASQKDTFSAFIMKAFNETKRFVNISPEKEVQFVKQIVPHIITEQVYRRVRQDKLLIVHDPTGSFLMKHVMSNQNVSYIEESTTYKPVLQTALETLSCQNKINYIVSSEIQEKLDTAILNLYHLKEIPISVILQQYLSLAHDIILILSPKLEYHEMMSQLRQGIKTSSQQQNYCSIEVQNVYNQNALIARIIYYGDVSNISQNQQLTFLYSCLSSTIKKSIKYKALLKNLRNEMGIMKLVDLFSFYGLIQNHSDETFHRFLMQMKKQYFAQFNKFNFSSGASNKSSTESENEEFRPNVRQFTTSQIVQEMKCYSKSLTANSQKYNEYAHFHSQSSNQIKYDTFEKRDTEEFRQSKQN